MSSKYDPQRTNRTPWTDVLSLISATSVTDAAGYKTNSENSRDIIGTFSQGINRTEFYEGMKAGISLSAEAEIWQIDYQGERLCEFEGRRYKIIRTYETGRGTLSLSLSEVIR